MKWNSFCINWKSLSPDANEIVRAVEFRYVAFEMSFQNLFLGPTQSNFKVTDHPVKDFGRRRPI